MPLVSVVIPTYNRADLVPLAIQSVLAQTFRDFELIVVDDGSQDNTLQVLARFGNRIHVLRQTNQGASAARNHGIRYAHGKYIAFLDSDDLWLPNKLERQIQVLEENPEIGLVYAQAYWMNEEGLRLKRPPHGYDQKDKNVSFATLTLGNLVCGGGSSAVVRRACLDTAGLFDEQIRFVEDWDLWLRIARYFPVVFIPEPLSYYRINTKGFRNWSPRPEQAEKIHECNLRVLHKVFSLWPADSSGFEEYSARAYAQEHVRHALVLISIGQEAQGSLHWQLALNYLRQYPIDRQILLQKIIDVVAAQVALVAPEQRVHQVRAVSQKLFTVLPSLAAHLEQSPQEIQARVLVELAFQAAQYNEVSAARECALAAIWHDRSCLKNRGLIRILVTGGRNLRPEPLNLEL